MWIFFFCAVRDNSTDPAMNTHLVLGGRKQGVFIIDYENSQVGSMNKSSPLPIFDLSSLAVSHSPLVDDYYTAFALVLNEFGCTFQNV